MSHTDLPLFAWQPPCKLIAFPLVNRIGKIRHTASLLITKHGEDADLYWKQVVAANRKHLSRVGLSKDKIEIELATFFHAVQGEMVRMTYQGHGTGGNAA